jgi:hypothetical protein
MQQLRQKLHRQQQGLHRTIDCNNGHFTDIEFHPSLASNASVVVASHDSLGEPDGRVVGPRAQPQDSPKKLESREACREFFQVVQCVERL